MTGVSVSVEIQLQVVIEPVEGLVEGAVCYETGLTRQQASDPTLYAYEHHGDDFGAADPGALSSLFEDMALGRPMPLKFVTPRIRGVDTIFAIALFLHRDLATHPQMPGIVAAVDLAHRRGVPMYGHIDHELTRFLRLLGALFPERQSRAERGERLRAAVAWVYEYVTNGNLPHLGPPMPQPTVLNVGTNGFVVATVPSDLHAGWVELYRQGYFRGVLVTTDRDRWSVLASRKSVYIEFNLSRAALLLNEVERAMGEPAEWVADELWLRSPPDGTTILLKDMVEIFLRV